MTLLLLAVLSARCHSPFCPKRAKSEYNTLTFALAAIAIRMKNINPRLHCKAYAKSAVTLNIENYFISILELEVEGFPVILMFVFFQ